METDVLAVLEINEQNEAFLNGSENRLGFGAAAELPVVLGPDRRLAHQRSDLSAHTAIVKDDRGATIYAVDVQRRGHYLLGADGFAFCPPGTEPYELERLTELICGRTPAPA